LKQFIISACLRFADAHTACARFWNDVAESLLTGKPIWLIREDREGQDHD
jgi:hypothetical protein